MVLVCPLLKTNVSLKNQNGLLLYQVRHPPILKVLRGSQNKNIFNGLMTLIINPILK
jgi:hypothetical protein